MIYLSQVLGSPVEDRGGTRIGKVTDVLVPEARAGQQVPVYPGALLIEGPEEQQWHVPLEAVERLEHALRLRRPLEEAGRQSAFSEHAIYLARDVLDKQVIDVERKKAVRVNEVVLDDDWRIQGVDNSALGLIRRLAPAWLFGPKQREAPAHLIAWEDIEFLGEQRPEELQDVQPAPTIRVQSGQLSELHPADIADILHQLTPGQGAQLLERLNDDIAADALEEVDTERQSYIMEKINADRAADILQAMGPDEAADLLAEMPEERARELLRLMNPEESEDVQDLLEYEENSAGGLMTTDYIALNEDRSAAEALEAVRSNAANEDIRAIYVYCVADETQDECPLLGVVSIWDLLVATPTRTLRELMETDLISVRPDADPLAVVGVMAKYNLFAVPVLSEHGILEGVVTVDDALDVLLPAGRRRKPPRMY